MNVCKIQRLSEQHQALIEFHKACNHNDVGLTVEVASYSNATLDYSATKTIIAEVRGILLDRLVAIEKEIEETVRNG